MRLQGVGERQGTNGHALRSCLVVTRGSLTVAAEVGRERVVPDQDTGTCADEPKLGQVTHVPCCTQTNRPCTTLSPLPSFWMVCS